MNASEGHFLGKTDLVDHREQFSEAGNGHRGIAARVGRDVGTNEEGLG